MNSNVNSSSNTVCLPYSHLLIIICVFLGFTIWYIHNDKKKHINEPDYKYDEKNLTDIVRKLLANDELRNTRQEETEESERRQYLNNRDSDVLYNNFTPPERRQPEHVYPYRYVRRQINIPTRGYPDRYQLVGVVLRDNTETAYRLYGRQKYPGSNQYEYYVEGSMDDTGVKLPIVIKGDKEIEDNQTVEIPGTNPARGEFKVKLYNFDTPRYVPIV